MSLTVVENLTGPVKQYPGGTIAIRCADYAVLTRGSISIVSDADSISGQVVHESQSLPYDTSAGFGAPLPADYEFPDMTAADPTLSIPLADLHANDNIQYAAFMHWKVIGAGSAGHRIGEDFMQASIQDIVLYGFNDTIDPSIQTALDLWVPRPTTNPTYRLTWFQYLEFDDEGWDDQLVATATDLLVVAAAGEDSTYETYLDAIILIPYQAASAAPYWHYLQYLGDPALFDPLFDNSTSDPQTTSANDDNDATNGLTTATQDAQFSVITTDSQGFSTNFTACGADYQRAKSEASFLDMNSFGLWSGPPPTWPDDPTSWIVYTGGPKLIPAHTIETETFGTNVTPDENLETFASTSGAYYWQITNDTFGTCVAVVTGGDFSVASLLANASQTNQAFATLGNASFPSDSATHSNAKQTLVDYSNGIVEGTAQIHTVADTTTYAVVGWYQEDWPRYNSSATPRTIAGVYLYRDGGNMKATLRANAKIGSAFTTAADFGTAPVTVGTSTDVIRVRVERRYYVWRAKVWVDGAGEPGSWTLEGFLPHFYTDLVVAPTTLNASQYPYSNDPRDNWGENCRAVTQWYPTVGVTVQPDPTPSGAAYCTFGELTASYNPGGSTMVPMHMNVVKYDASVDYGSAQLDGDRVVIAGLTGHTFDDDTHGTTVWLWSDPGAPDLQPSVLSDAFIRAPLSGWGDIKHP